MKILIFHNATYHDTFWFTIELEKAVSIYTCYTNSLVAFTYFFLSREYHSTYIYYKQYIIGSGITMMKDHSMVRTLPHPIPKHATCTQLSPSWKIRPNIIVTLCDSTSLLIKPRSKYTQQRV